jgi:hypothetical protein
VSRHQQLAGSACSEQLDSYKNWSDHHSMHSIHSDGIDGIETRQRLTSRPAEGNVSTDFPHRTARLDSSHDISSRQMLVLKAHVGLCENSHFVQAEQGLLRQREPAMCEQVLFLSH